MTLGKVIKANEPSRGPAEDESMHRGLTSAESRCWRVSRVWPSWTQAANLASRASISEQIPWWYFCRSSTDETSLMKRKKMKMEEH